MSTEKAQAAPSTLIKCLLKRAGGTKIELYGTNYHFKPDPEAKDDPEAPHVCAVSNPAAIYRLLAIKEGYALVDPDAQLPERPKAMPGQTIAADKKEKGAVTPVVIQDADGKDIVLTDMTPDELRTLAKEEFKIAVHHKWNDQTVIAKIIEKVRGTD